MSKKKIDLNKPIVGLDGKAQDDQTIGKLVANLLASEGSTDKSEILKYGDWAQALWRGETLELDQADFEKLQSAIVKSTNFPIWHKHKALSELG